MCFYIFGWTPQSRANEYHKMWSMWKLCFIASRSSVVVVLRGRIVDPTWQKSTWHKLHIHGIVIWIYFTFPPSLVSYIILWRAWISDVYTYISLAKVPKEQSNAVIIRDDDNDITMAVSLRTIQLLLCRSQMSFPYINIFFFFVHCCYQCFGFFSCCFAINFLFGIMSFSFSLRYFVVWARDRMRNFISLFNKKKKICRFFAFFFSCLMNLIWRHFFSGVIKI